MTILFTSRLRAISAGPLLLSVLLCGITVESRATGVDEMPAQDRREALQQLLEQTGVTAQLALLNHSVSEEVERRPVNCSSQSTQNPSPAPRLKQFLPSQRDTLLKNLLSAESLQLDMIESLDESLEGSDIRSAQKWFASPTGKEISEIEAASGDLDRDEFEKLAGAYLESSRWSDHRKQLIGGVLSDTLAPEFVTALNTATLSLAILASSCAASNPDTDEASEQLARSLAVTRTFGWHDKFVAVLIKQDLIPVSGTLFRDLDTAELQRYSDYATSPVGQHFFTALVENVIKLLQGRVESLHQALSAQLKAPVPEK